VLGNAGDDGPESHWSLAPTGGPLLASRSREVRALDSAGATTNYVISVTTGDFVAAGTDDKVEISLVGTSGAATDYVELKNSETHWDPFERGNTDRFTVALPNVGTIEAVDIRYGANDLLFPERWVLQGLSVYDPTTLTTYYSGTLGNGTQYQVPSETTILMGFAAIGGSGSTMGIGKAPTQDSITNGWVDHTWATVTDDTSRRTYFDCAGGHGGPGTVDNIITATCSLDTAVKMATGFDIEPSHPYKPAYGTDDKNGVETCGVRASGSRNWDGQCHQMVNRLLYVCSPPGMLDDVPDAKRPVGYGLSRLLWGPFALGFTQWCTAHGFVPPREDSWTVFDFIQRTIKSPAEAREVAYLVLTMQGALANDPQNPQGPAVKAFFQHVKKEGIDNSTMATLVNLTEAEVVQEQQGAEEDRALAPAGP
jgi:hypothetical protein